MIPYRVVFSSKAKKAIERFPTQNLKPLAERVFLQISENPFSGTKLSGNLSGLYSVRITRRYQAIYWIDFSRRIVTIVSVDHRKEAD